MKKLAIAMLSAILVFSMAGCGGAGAGSGKEDAKSIYDAATEKNSKLTDMDMTSKMTMKMEAKDQSLDITMNSEAKINQINTEKMQMAMTSKTSMSGQDVDMNIYYKDGYYYIDAAGQKSKMAMNLDDIMKQVKSTTEGGNVGSDMMKELSVKKDGDNQVVTFTCDPKKMNEYVTSMLGQTMGNSTDTSAMKLTIKNASGTATIGKDGYFTATKLKFDCTMEISGEEATMSMDMDATINNPGQPVEVTLPALDDFKEVAKQ